MSFAAGRAAARPCDLLPALLQSSPQHPSADRPHQHLRPPRDQGAGPPPPRTTSIHVGVCICVPDPARPHLRRQIFIGPFTDDEDPRQQKPGGRPRVPPPDPAHVFVGPAMLPNPPLLSHFHLPPVVRGAPPGVPIPSLPFLLCETEHPKPT